MSLSGFDFSAAMPEPDAPQDAKKMSGYAVNTNGVNVFMFAF
jgi:hypothetical protein